MQGYSGENEERVGIMENECVHREAMDRRAGKSSFSEAGASESTRLISEKIKPIDQNDVRGHGGKYEQLQGDSRGIDRGRVSAVACQGALELVAARGQKIDKSRQPVGTMQGSTIHMVSQPRAIDGQARSIAAGLSEVRAVYTPVVEGKTQTLLNPKDLAKGNTKRHTPLLPAFPPVKWRPLSDRRLSFLLVRVFSCL